MTRVRLAGAAIAAAAVVAAVLVMVRPDGASPPEAGAAPTVAGPLRLASCREWNQATGPQRLGTVHQLARLSSAPVAGLAEARGPVLDDQQAYDMLTRSCAPAHARAFKLYKLYGRSAAFVGH